MKTELNIEESARLIELGVDAKLASMVSWKQTENWQRKSVLGDKEHLQLKPFRPMVMGYEKFDCKDIFTLTDILSILPKEIVSDTIMQEKDRCPLLMEWDPRIRKWRTAYAYIGMPVNLENPIGVAPELIDALNSLLIWAIESNHNNPKSEDK